MISLLVVKQASQCERVIADLKAEVERGRQQESKAVSGQNRRDFPAPFFFLNPFLIMMFISLPRRRLR